MNYPHPLLLDFSDLVVLGLVHLVGFVWVFLVGTSISPIFWCCCSRLRSDMSVFEKGNCVCIIDGTICFYEGTQYVPLFVICCSLVSN